MKKLLRKKGSGIKVRKEVTRRCVCGCEMSFPIYILRLIDDGLMEVCENCYISQEKELYVQGEVLNQIMRAIANQQGGVNYE